MSITRRNMLAGTAAVAASTLISSLCERGTHPAHKVARSLRVTRSFFHLRIVQWIIDELCKLLRQRLHILVLDDRWRADRAEP